MCFRVPTGLVFCELRLVVGRQRLKSRQRICNRFGVSDIMRECLLVALLDLLSTCVKIMGFFFFCKNRQQQQEHTPIYHPHLEALKKNRSFVCLQHSTRQQLQQMPTLAWIKTVEETATQKKKPETDLHHIFQEDSVQEFEWIGGSVLLPVLTKSNSIGAQYVTLQMKIRWKEVKICRFVSAKWVLCPAIFHSLLRLVRGTAKINTCQRRM